MRGSKEEPVRSYDSPEEIERCQSCPFPKCSASDACWHRLGLEKPPEPVSALDKDGEGRRLLALGLTDAQIGDIMGMTAGQVAYWRKKNGLRAGRFRRNE